MISFIYANIVVTLLVMILILEKIEPPKLTREERDKINMSGLFGFYLSRRYRKKMWMPPIHINCRCDVVGFKTETERLAEAVRRAMAIPAEIIMGRAKSNIKAGDLLSIGDDGLLRKANIDNKPINEFFEYSNCPFRKGIGVGSVTCSECHCYRGKNVNHIDLKRVWHTTTILCSFVPEKKEKSMKKTESKWSDEIIEGINYYLSLGDYNKEHFCPFNKNCSTACGEIFKPIGFGKAINPKCPCQIYGKETVEARFNVILKEVGKQPEKKKEEKTYQRGGVWKSESGIVCVLSSVSSGNVRKMNFICSDGDRWSGTFTVDDFRKIRKLEIPTDSLFYTGFDSIEDYYRDKFGDDRQECKNTECRKHCGASSGGCREWRVWSNITSCEDYKPKG